jgi:hypothetical protein
VFVATATGDHRFFVSADDQSSLYQHGHRSGEQAEIAANRSGTVPAVCHAGSSWRYAPGSFGPHRVDFGNKYYLERITSEGGGGNSSTAVQGPAA